MRTDRLTWVWTNAHGIRGRREIVAFHLAFFLALCALSPPLYANEKTAGWHDMPPQQLLFWNARNQLRAGKPMDVVRLWLLHNSLAAAGERPDAREEAHFRSALWVALGELGQCPDGLPKDNDAASLWILSMFNWMMRAYGQEMEAEDPSYWDAFQAGYQARPISLHDVLDAEELEAFAVQPNDCHAELWTMLRLRMWPTKYPDDRYRLGAFLRELLVHAQRYMNSYGIEGMASLRVRLFDLNVEMVRLVGEKLRAEDDAADEILRQIGVGEEQIDRYRFRRGRTLRKAEERELLLEALTWPVAEWMTLSPGRRIALFRDLDTDAFDTEQRDRLWLGIIDELIEGQQGAELQKWLGFDDRGTRPQRIASTLFDGVRGKQILSLSRASGFQEQSVVGLHRGLVALQRGKKLQALRSLAFAMGESSSSAKATEIHSLAFRWFSFVMSQYQSTSEILEVIDSFVPRADARALHKTLLWRAALHRDEESFQKVRSRLPKESSRSRWLRQLEKLLSGDAAYFLTVSEESSQRVRGLFARRFLFAYIERLSAEPIDVRAKHVPLLAGLRENLLRALEGANATRKKTLERLLERLQIQLDALGQFDDSIRGQAQAASPGWEAYAGSIRLAPTDDIPWPFTLPQDRVPSAFRPLRLTPVEWRDPDQALVYGWRIHE